MQDANEPWWVVCLCAGWCGVCRDWRPVFEAAARAEPATQFAWVDVEDEADTLGEVDIETFPTLLVAQGAQVRFLGPIPPLAAQLTRLVASLQSAGASAGSIGGEAQALMDRLRVHVLPSSRL